MNLFQEQLNKLLSGLNIKSVEGMILFNQPAKIKPMSSATIRGIAGNLLVKSNIHYAQEYFKPGDGGSQPSACLFESMVTKYKRSSSLPFRIKTWCLDDEFLNTLVNLLAKLENCSFSEEGAEIKKIFFCDITPLKFSFDFDDYQDLRINLTHPLLLKSRNGKWINKNRITLGHVVKASVLRLNKLSEYYGNKIKLDLQYALAETAFSRMSYSNLDFVEDKRFSKTQNRVIRLGGITGYFCYLNLSPSIVALLQASSHFHIGKHASSGCGMISTEKIKYREVL